MTDIFVTQHELGLAIRELRKRQRLKMVKISTDSGISRDVIYRLEQGKDVYVSSLLDTLRAMGYGIRLERHELPTLQEMREYSKRELELDDPD